MGYNPDVSVKRGDQVAPFFAAAAFAAIIPCPKEKGCACSAWAAGAMPARQN